jgi:hypothetical protein
MRSEIISKRKWNWNLADLHFSPFPHMIIDGIFPRDVYQSVLDLNYSRGKKVIHGSRNTENGL